jgi:hypothetical protein
MDRAGTPFDNGILMTCAVSYARGLHAVVLTYRHLCFEVVQMPIHVQVHVQVLATSGGGQELRKGSPHHHTMSYGVQG